MTLKAPPNLSTIASKRLVALGLTLVTLTGLSACKEAVTSPLDLCERNVGPAVSVVEDYYGRVIVYGEELICLAWHTDSGWNLEVDTR